MKRFSCWMLLSSLVTCVIADDFGCYHDCDNSELFKSWYIWVILVISLAVFIFIIGCLKACCHARKTPVPNFEGQRIDVAIISTVDTVAPLPHVGQQGFTPGVGGLMSPPPYSLYEQENPPQYDEALKMPVNKFILPTGYGIEASSPQLGLQQQDVGSAPGENPPPYNLYNIPAEEFLEVDLSDGPGTQTAL